MKECPPQAEAQAAASRTPRGYCSGACDRPDSPGSWGLGRLSHTARILEPGSKPRAACLQSL